jgi:hypothetical protein
MMIDQKFSGWLQLPRLHIEADAAARTRCERCTKQCPMSILVMDKLGSLLHNEPDCCLAVGAHGDWRPCPALANLAMFFHPGQAFTKSFQKRPGLKT